MSKKGLSQVRNVAKMRKKEPTKHKMKEIDPYLFFSSTIKMCVGPTSTLIQACLWEDFCVLDDAGLHIY